MVHRWFMGIFKISLLVASMMVTGSALAQAVGHKTNINQVTDLFDKEIEGKEDLEYFLKKSKQQAEQGIENKSAIQELQISEGEAENATSRLNNINANDLAIQGQNERNKAENSYFDLLEVDYSSPHLVEHRKDVDLISSASSKLITRLIQGLKDLDMDCQEIKGNKEQEAEYYLDINKEVTKDTVYDQVFCEQLRHSYSCTEHLVMTCKTKGYHWQTSEARVFTYNWYNIRDNWKELTIVGGEYSYCRWYTMYNTPSVMAEVRADIARNIGVKLEQIEPWLDIPQTKLKAASFCATDIFDFIKDIVQVGYRLRQGRPICLEWQEEWQEECVLN